MFLIISSAIKTTVRQAVEGLQERRGTIVGKVQDVVVPVCASSKVYVAIDDL